jgi:hypothetical protein
MGFLSLSREHRRLPMTDATGGDVERHYKDLEKQLLEDGFPQNSPVMKMTEKLRLALREDGFSLEEGPALVSAEAEDADDDEPLAVMPEPVTFIAAAEEESPEIVRAFRAKDALDSNVVVSVFAAIDGWRTRVIQRGDNHYIIATNAKTLTEAHVKQALTAYATEVRSVKTTSA